MKYNTESQYPSGTPDDLIFFEDAHTKDKDTVAAYQEAVKSGDYTAAQDIIDGMHSYDASLINAMQIRLNEVQKAQIGKTEEYLHYYHSDEEAELQDGQVITELDKSNEVFSNTMSEVASPDISFQTYQSTDPNLFKVLRPSYVFGKMEITKTVYDTITDEGGKTTRVFSHYEYKINQSNTYALSERLDAPTDMSWFCANSDYPLYLASEHPGDYTESNDGFVSIVGITGIYAFNKDNQLIYKDTAFDYCLSSNAANEVSSVPSMYNRCLPESAAYIIVEAFTENSSLIDINKYCYVQYFPIFSYHSSRSLSKYNNSVGLIKNNVSNLTGLDKSLIKTLTFKDGSSSISEPLASQKGARYYILQSGSFYVSLELYVSWQNQDDYGTRIYTKRYFKLSDLGIKENPIIAAYEKEEPVGADYTFTNNISYSDYVNQNKIELTINNLNDIETSENALNDIYYRTVYDDISYIENHLDAIIPEINTYFQNLGYSDAKNYAMEKWGSSLISRLKASGKKYSNVSFYSVVALDDVNNVFDASVFIGTDISNSNSFVSVIDPNEVVINCEYDNYIDYKRSSHQ